LTAGPQTENQTSSVPSTDTPWAFRLVRLAIIGVILAFLLIMLLYAWLDVFNENNAANISAALSSLFGIVGTLVGAYFGIKATSESKTTIENVHKETGDKLANAAQAATSTAQKATDTAQAAIKEASTTTQTAAKETAAAAKTASTAGSTSLWLGALASLSVSLLGLLGLLFWWARHRPS
jgi:predicted PurR-regulated permease PerM